MLLNDLKFPKLCQAMSSRHGEVENVTDFRKLRSQNCTGSPRYLLSLLSSILRIIDLEMIFFLGTTL